MNVKFAFLCCKSHAKNVKSILKWQIEGSFLNIYALLGFFLKSLCLKADHFSGFHG